jgi:outer membrane protein TolC
MASRFLAFLLLACAVTVTVAGAAPATTEDDEADEELPAAEATAATTATTAMLSLEPSPLTSVPRLALTLEAVLGVARQRGREARLAQEELASAYQKLNFVRAGYHPTGVAQGDESDARSVKLEQKLGQGTRASMNVDRKTAGRETKTYTIDHALFVNNAFDVRMANLTFAVARENFRVRIEDYKLDVVRKFFELVRAQLRLRTLIDAVGRAGELVASARARFELGTTSKLDVLNTEVVLANARSDALQQRQVVDRTRDELLDAIGMPLEAPLDAVDPLTLERPGDPAEGWYRSELSAERGKVDLARTALREARYLAMPDVRVNGQMVDDGVAGNREVLATVRYNFPIGTAPSDHTFRQLKHAYETAELTFKNLEFRVAREQRDILRTLKTKEETVAIAKQALANATESFESSQIQFARGLISNIDLRNAQDNLTQARDRYLGQLIDYRVAVYQYRRLFGGDL